MLHTLFVVRHGETLWNQEFRLQGRLDSALTEIGKRQANENGKLLKRLGVERLLVSPLGRTTETAYIINSHVQGELEFIDALVERDSGSWSGLTVEDIRNTQPQQWRAREVDEWNHRPPDGENMPDVIARITPLLDRLLDGLQAETTAPSPLTAIISHGVVGKAILTHYLKLPSVVGSKVRQPNDVVYALSFAGRAGSPEGGVSCEHFRRGEGPLGGVVSSEVANTFGQSGQ